MRAVLQRVSQASVSVHQELVAKIDKGILVLLGIEDTDKEFDIQWLVNKILKMRIFDDEQGIMNLSLQDIHGDLLIVSQFTLHALTKKGNRPSYIRAAKPEIAKPMYEKFVSEAEKALGKAVQKGIFGADMKIHLCNDGPVTILMDTHNKE